MAPKRQPNWYRLNHLLPSRSARQVSRIFWRCFGSSGGLTTSEIPAEAEAMRLTQPPGFPWNGTVKELLQNGVLQATADFANGVSVMNAVEKLLEALSREVAEGLSGGNVLLTMGAMNALERALGQSSREVPDAPGLGAHGGASQRTTILPPRRTLRR